MCVFFFEEAIIHFIYFVRDDHFYFLGETIYALAQQMLPLTCTSPQPTYNADGIVPTSDR